jgi:hypothetical protein
MQDILIISAIVSILIIWFDTDAFVEYAKLYGVRSLFFIDFYEGERAASGGALDYPSFLRIKFNNFFTRLISCQLCSGLWISAVLALSIDKFSFCLFYYVSSTVIYLFIKKQF